MEDSGNLDTGLLAPKGPKKALFEKIDFF